MVVIMGVPFSKKSHSRSLRIDDENEERKMRHIGNLIFRILIKLKMEKTGEKVLGRPLKI